MMILESWGLNPFEIDDLFEENLNEQITLKAGLNKNW